MGTTSSSKKELLRPSSSMSDKHIEQESESRRKMSGLSAIEEDVRLKENYYGTVLNN